MACIGNMRVAQNCCSLGSNEGSGPEDGLSCPSSGSGEEVPSGRDTLQTLFRPKFIWRARGLWPRALHKCDPAITMEMIWGILPGKAQAQKVKI